MTRAAPLGLVVGSTGLIAVGYAAAFLPGDPPAWAPWCLAVGTSTLLLAMMLLGAYRPGRSLRPLFLPLLATYVILVGGLGLALLLPPEEAGATLWLGLPRRAALLIYGIGVVPAAILPLAYARTFDRLTLSGDDLERIGAARARREQAGA